MVQWRPLPFLVAFLFTLMIFVIHMLPGMDSMLNENNIRISHGFLKSQIEYHQEIAPFVRRPLTSLLIEGVVQLFGWRYGHAFIFINFILLFLSGPLVFKLSKTMQASTGQALVNMGVYFLSFSVLFAFFPPIFSYDEPLQYCFILLSLIAFVRRKWMWFVPLFTLALIARETSILLLPALLFFGPGLWELGNPEKHGKTERHRKPEKYMETEKHGQPDDHVTTERDWRLKRRLKYTVPILLPIVCYGIYLILFIVSNNQLQATKVEMASRYTCFLENFESTKNTVETWISLFFALGPFLYLVAVRMWKKKTTAFYRQCIGAFLLTAVINTPIVILTAFARETRLFALPLIFIWPVFAQLFAREVQLLFTWDLYRKVFGKWRYLIPVVLALFLNYWFCFQVYPGLGLGENTLFGEYLFLINLFIVLHFLLQNPASDTLKSPG
ncbi:MAG TPA: hypothetical protein VFM69_03270 [Pricia sp.]|nr:hypothetical protein [Pricia sp.]